MSLVATAIVGSAVVGGAVSAYSANKAAKSQAAATDKGIRATQEADAIARDNLRPYAEIGLPAAGRLGQFEQAGVNAIGGADYAQRQGLDQQIAALQEQIGPAQAGPNAEKIAALTAQRDRSIGAGQGLMGGVTPAQMDLDNEIKALMEQDAQSVEGGMAGIAQRVQMNQQLRALTDQRDYMGDAGQQAGGLIAYQDAGSSALQQQQAAMGLAGPEAQQEYIQGLESSPYMQAMMEQGENAMLQNASATGGLRGGNIQGALAQFRPQMMQQYMDRNYSRLGGLAAQGGNVGQFLAGQGQAATSNLFAGGQAAAAGQAASAQQTGANIANLQGQAGASEAGLAMAQGNNMANLFGMAGQGIGYGLANRAPAVQAPFMQPGGAPAMGGF